MMENERRNPIRALIPWYLAYLLAVSAVYFVIPGFQRTFEEFGVKLSAISVWALNLSLSVLGVFVEDGVTFAGLLINLLVLAIGLALVCATVMAACLPSARISAKTNRHLTMLGVIALVVVIAFLVLTIGLPYVQMLQQLQGS